MPKVFDYCPADKFEGDDGCAGCPALPGTEHCEAVFRDTGEQYSAHVWDWIVARRPWTLLPIMKNPLAGIRLNVN